MGELADVVQEITLYAGVKRIEFRTILLDVQRETISIASRSRPT